MNNPDSSRFVVRIDVEDRGEPGLPPKADDVSIALAYGLKAHYGEYYAGPGIELLVEVEEVLA